MHTHAEVGAEKPSPLIFEAAVSQLGVSAAECVHVGDDRRNDVWGGRCAPFESYLAIWGNSCCSCCFSTLIACGNALFWHNCGFVQKADPAPLTPPRDAGVTAWLWGSDVHTFEEVARRVLHMQRSGLTAWDDEED